MITIPVEISVSEVTIDVDISATEVTIPVEMSAGFVQGPYYDGEYEVTPTQETQTLYTTGRTLANDVVINPIPSNYGLITWNGSVLTVS